MRVTQIAAAAAMVATVLMSGCRVQTNKQDGNENVRIATPFGGVQVKTNDTTVLEGMGLPGYPGATLVKKDHDHGAADVNMNFGNFHLRVKAASYETPDSSDKVEAFYRKALGAYGDVIECSNDKSVGEPTHTTEGLTCDNDTQHVAINDDISRKLELKAGSKQHQHIVAIDPNGTGTKLGLVVLDLPGHSSDGKESVQ
ncbi:hypothetical protein [Edaphobacter dinghuensis]|uniref:Lipoprotein n=1 Tax=Edaphobacter dinghuensis TaxID=1560005 RepID=A0A917LZM8_9BACT|nr:hypothetical protein [Edaphobacter dinghuensis]GGG68200.1 hypothetical protein GCM10011585_07680 [Edaphobacter dinghuensis]